MACSKQFSTVLFCIISVLSCCCFNFTNVFAQCNSSKAIYEQLEALDGSSEFKLERARDLCQQFEQCGFEKDSVYVRLLDRIGLFFYLSEGNKISDAISWGRKAAVASRLAKNKSNFITAKAFLNLGLYLSEVNESLQAIAMCDTVVRLCSGSDHRTKSLMISALLKSAYLLFDLGEYKLCVDKASLVIPKIISIDDSAALAKVYALRSLAYSRLLQTDDASNDASLALKIVDDQGGYTTNVEAYLNAIFVKAELAFASKDYANSDHIFGNALENCRRLGFETNDVYNFYMWYGNYLSDQKKNYIAAIKWYQQCIRTGDPVNNATAYLNISQNYWRLKQFDNAERYFILAKSIQSPNNPVKDLVSTIPADKWNIIANKDQLTVTINNNLELLLTRFNVSGNAKFLMAAKSLAKTGDSVLALLRHEQLEEVSKLYWRDRTREFYRYALETAFLSNDNELAFYFMEKSRAVILNDQIQTVYASKILPESEAANEQKLRIEIIKQTRSLSQPGLPANQYQAIERSLLEAKERFRVFTKSIEKAYPAYYRVKYADEVPTLQQLQSYLAENQQSFVHYFMADTVAYVMAISANDVVLKKLSQPGYNKKDIVDFLQLCSQPSLLNAGYAHYKFLSNKIYATYLKPLQLKQPRVIICPDNYLIPFEALAVGDQKNHFLLHDYAFSYVYAARNLLMKFPFKKSEGNFLGIAPVSFASNLKVPSLRESGDAIETSGSFFNFGHMIVGKDATKRSFLNNIGHYEVVNVYSHAVSDSSVREPAIYMNDSIIYLSELQLINDISAQLVLLSACQTSVGRNATGEGIYSLARGLAAVGIPSVAATLWEADESSIYLITEKFNEGIAKGLPKDIALQQAKLWFLNKASAEKKLVPYWSNMIIIGNTSPVVFSEHINYSKIILLAVLVVLVVAVIFIVRRRNKNRENSIQIPA